MESSIETLINFSRVSMERFRSVIQLLYLVTLMSNSLRTNHRLQADSIPYEDELYVFSRCKSLENIYFVQVDGFDHYFYRKQ